MSKKKFSVVIKCDAFLDVDAYTDKQAKFLAKRQWIEWVEKGAVNDADAWEVVEVYEENKG